MHVAQRSGRKRKIHLEPRETNSERSVHVLKLTSLANEISIHSFEVKLTENHVRFDFLKCLNKSANFLVHTDAELNIIKLTSCFLSDD